MEFLGYKRKNGRAGVRNHLAVIPSVFCAKKVAEKISENVEDAIYLDHSVGCSQVGEDLEQTARTLINLGKHPNVGGVLIVGLGCERFTSEEFYNSIKKTGKPVERVVIQEEGNTLNAIRKGTDLLYKLHSKIKNQKREKIDISELVIGLECGGSDATSAMAANPAIGAVSDELISHGGSSIFSEITELIGAEHILKERCSNESVVKRLMEVIEKTERELAISTSKPEYKNRSDLISTGNFEGGISTVVEKALGNINKAGKAPINGVLDFAERLEDKRGLYLMDTPGQDGESTTGLVAGEAQIILFTTGRGTPTGFPTAPVIKITGNPKTYHKMTLNNDINAGKIIDGENDIEEMGKEIFDELIEVASGKKTKAEILGHDELFNIPRVLSYCPNNY